MSDKQNKADTESSTESGNAEAMAVTDAQSTAEAKAKRFRFNVIVLVILLPILAYVMRYAYVFNAKLRAREQIKFQQFDKALSTLDFAKTLMFNQDPELLLLEARVYRKTAKKKEFEATLHQAEGMGLNKVQLEREQVMSKVQIGNFDDIEKLRESPEGDHTIVMDEGEIFEAMCAGYVVKGDLAIAANYVEKWKELHPDDPRNLFISGAIHRLMRNKQKAREAFESTLELCPDYDQASMELGLLHIEDKEFDQALTRFKECFDSPVHRATAMMNVASVYEAQANTESAKKLLSEIIEEFPEKLDAVAALGKLEVTLGNAEEGIKHLEKAMTRYAYDPTIQGAYGNALRSLGKVEQATPFLQYAQLATGELSRARDLLAKVTSGEGTIEDRVEIGAIYAKHGSKRDSMIWIQDALKRDPENERAKEVLKALEARPQ